MADGVVDGLGRERTVTVCMDGPSHEDVELPWSHCDEHRRANLCSPPPLFSQHPLPLEVVMIKSLRTCRSAKCRRDGRRRWGHRFFNQKAMVPRVRGGGPQADG